MNDSSRRSPDRVAVGLLACGIAAVVASRLCHNGLVWIEEGYGMSAAAELLRGKSLYTDIWFDKPPLYAWFYTLGPLRAIGIAWVLMCALSVYLAGSRLWDRATGVLAAALTCFALTFWIPATVMAIAPDLLMLVPHVLAVWAIASGRPVLAGALAGVALQCNSKALLMVPVLIAWDWRAGLRTLTGFASVVAVSSLALPFREYWHQVWWWGSRYSSDTFVNQPARELLVRSAGWAGFHATAVLGSGVYLWRTRDWRILVWAGVSIVAVTAGWRFFPRYYFHLLPVAVLAGAKGLMLVRREFRWALLSLLLIPVLRFGPRYVQVALHGTTGWSDAAMMQDSRDASQLLESGTLFVWGYRPDVYVFSKAPAGTPFLDSQPLTGVLADRHLFSSSPTFPEVARENRKRLIASRPDYIIDGLGPLNPDLAIQRFGDLQTWLSDYEVIGRTPMSVVLRRRPGR